MLAIDLTGRDPDEAATSVPYVKGALFLQSLEHVFGRARFDRFLRGYFDRFAFQSLTTKEAIDYLRKELLSASPELGGRVPIDDWLIKPGLPTRPRTPSRGCCPPSSSARPRGLRIERRSILRRSAPGARTSGSGS